MMDDMKVTATGYDFAAAHAAMRRYVDGNLLSGVSSAVLVGRELVDVNCVGWANKEAQTPLRVDHIFRIFSNTKLVTSCAALLLFEERSRGSFHSLQIAAFCAPARPHWMRPSRRRDRSPSVI